MLSVEASVHQQPEGSTFKKSDYSFLKTQIQTISTSIFELNLFIILVYQMLAGG